MTVPVPKPLRLLAESAEDFRILSGVLQDSLLVPQQLRWQKGLGRFFLPLSRFCWEIATDDKGPFFRVASELAVGGVVAARHRGFESMLTAKDAGKAKGEERDEERDEARDEARGETKPPPPLANLLAVELAEGPCLRLTFSRGLELCLLGEGAGKGKGTLPASSLCARLTDSRDVQRTDKLPSHRS